MILEGARYLALGIVNVVHTIDPEIVVLGGAMNFGGNDNPIGEAVSGSGASRVSQSHISLSGRAHRSLILRGLGGDAGYIGAAGLAARSLYTD